MWKMDDGIFPAGFTGSGISELHTLLGWRATTTFSAAVISTLHGMCSMGDGNELAAVGVGKPGKVRKTVRDDIV